MPPILRTDIRLCLLYISVFINPYRSSFNVEQAMTLKPYLTVFDTVILAKLKNEGTLALLEKSGIPFVFIDFRQQPLSQFPGPVALMEADSSESILLLF